MIQTRLNLGKVIGSAVVLCTFIVGWELLSRLITATGSYDEPLVPGWEYLWSNSLLRMADYWPGGLGVGSPMTGDPPTYTAAFLALAKASLVTIARVLAGVVLGVVVGTALGLLVSMSRLASTLVAPTVHIMRMAPFLAMIPLFNLWFGASLFGIILFIAYGVAVIMFIGALNAVGNLPSVYAQRARVSGAGWWQTYQSVILPAILPELRATFMMSLGLAWSLVVAGELLGAQEGLGVIVTYALQFAYTGRVIIIAFLLLIYAAIFFALAEYVSRRVLAWHRE